MYACNACIRERVQVCVHICMHVCMRMYVMYVYVRVFSYECIDFHKCYMSGRAQVMYACVHLMILVSCFLCVIYSRRHV